MYTLLMILFVIICIALIGVILAQSSKGGGLEGVVGNTASSLLGGQGASEFLKNATRILAIVFVLLCVLLAFQVPKTGGSTSSKAVKALQKEAAKETQAQPLSELPAEDTAAPADQGTTE
jgi:preprotein translocase subunit SecG